MEKIIETLDKMVEKPFLYKNEQVVILDYCDGTGENGDEVEIYLNNGTTLEVSYACLSAKLNQFKPITAQVVVLANKKLDSVSSVNPNVMQELRDTVMEQIRALKTDASTVNQAKQVFAGVNTMINLAKTELEYRRFLNNLEDKQ